MSKDLAKRQQVIHDLLLTTFIQSQSDENRTTVPLMLEVPVSWLQLLKDFTRNSSDIDFGESVEVVLTGIFMFGLEKCLEDLRERYPKPIDIYKELVKLMA